ncbi:hypothetical protein HDU96_001182 [Phlyctochytrium bullatum]|nr:hypothetical protein HDU96_001182 [Phlyctochytrium bullatum]
MNSALLQMPLEVVAEISTSLNPIDVVTLARSSKQGHSVWGSPQFAKIHLKHWLQGPQRATKSPAGASAKSNNPEDLDWTLLNTAYLAAYISMTPACPSLIGILCGWAKDSGALFPYARVVPDRHRRAILSAIKLADTTWGVLSTPSFLQPRALEFACYLDSPKLFRTLLANLDTTHPVVRRSLEDCVLLTGHLAAKSGRKGFWDFLVETHGALLITLDKARYVCEMACQLGDDRVVRRWIEGPTLDIREGTRDFGMWAVRENHIDIVRMLLEHPRLVYAPRWAPLDVSGGIQLSDAMFDFLLERRLLVEISALFSVSVRRIDRLIEVVGKKHRLEDVQQLVMHMGSKAMVGKDSADLAAFARLLKHPFAEKLVRALKDDLKHIVGNGSKDLLKVFLDAMSDAELPGFFSEAFIMAVAFRKTDYLKLLLSYPRVKALEIQECIDAFDSACLLGFVDVVKTIMADPTFDAMPLNLRRGVGNEDVAHLLLAIPRFDPFANNAQVIANSVPHPRVVNLLLSAATRRDPENPIPQPVWPALLAAAIPAPADTLTLLLERPELQSTELLTHALVAACACHNLPAVTVLLSHPAVDTTNLPAAFTAIAAQSPVTSPELLRCLLQHPRVRAEMPQAYLAELARSAAESHNLLLLDVLLVEGGVERLDAFCPSPDAFRGLVERGDVKALERVAGYWGVEVGTVAFDPTVLLINGHLDMLEHVFRARLAAVEAGTPVPPLVSKQPPQGPLGRLGITARLAAAIFDLGCQADRPGLAGVVLDALAPGERMDAKVVAKALQAASASGRAEVVGMLLRRCKGNALAGKFSPMSAAGQALWVRQVDVLAAMMEEQGSLARKTRDDRPAVVLDALALSERMDAKVVAKVLQAASASGRAEVVGMLLRRCKGNALAGKFSGQALWVRQVDVLAAMMEEQGSLARKVGKKVKV